MNIDDIRQFLSNMDSTTRTTLLNSIITHPSLDVKNKDITG